MPRYQMTNPGTAFIQDGIDLSWPRGRAESDVIEIEDIKEAPASFRQAVTADRITETDRDVTSDGKVVSDDVAARILTGKEALAKMAEPPAPVTIDIRDQQTGETRTVTLDGGTEREDDGPSVDEGTGVVRGVAGAPGVPMGAAGTGEPPAGGSTLEEQLAATAASAGTTEPTEPSEPEPAAGGELDLEALTVADLRDLAETRGVAIPSDARKADIVELLRG